MERELRTPYGQKLHNSLKYHLPKQKSHCHPSHIIRQVPRKSKVTRVCRCMHNLEIVSPGYKAAHGMCEIK